MRRKRRNDQEGNSIIKTKGEDGQTTGKCNEVMERKGEETGKKVEEKFKLSLNHSPDKAEGGQSFSSFLHVFFWKLEGWMLE